MGVSEARKKCREGAKDKVHGGGKAREKPTEVRKVGRSAGGRR
jgi:hypothetical protein